MLGGFEKGSICWLALFWTRLLLRQDYSNETGKITRADALAIQRTSTTMVLNVMYFKSNTVGLGMKQYNWFPAQLSAG